SKNPTLEELFSDPEQFRQMHEQLYSRKPLLEQGSPFAHLLQTMVNAALDGEVLGHVAETRAQGEENKRNGYTDKTILSEAGPLSIRTPRDRQGTFEPQLVPKRERELSSGLDTQILALYAQGNSVEDIKRLLQTMFGVDISAGKISAITDQVLPVIQEWRNRRLLEFYAVIYMDAIHFKVRHEGKYSSRAFYTVYSVDGHGNRDLLGMYMSENEGANQWGLVLEDLKFRGVEDVLVFCTDDLTGFSEAMNDVFPATVVQKCLVHKMRNTTRFVDDKDMKAVVRGLKAVYKADTQEAAATALEAFEVEWGHKYSSIVVSWRRDWDELMAFLDFPIALRRMIYTTNPVEAVHRIIRKLIKGKAAWASDTALMKQVYLSLMHNEKSWRKQAYGWKAIQRDLVKL
ncbi:IS256 family transposase, partial [Neolewinella lacunae]